MALKEIVVVPYWWGPKWRLDGAGPFHWLEFAEAASAILSNRFYTSGLASWGLSTGSLVLPGYIDNTDPTYYREPNFASDREAYRRLEELIDAGELPTKKDFDPERYVVVHATMTQHDSWYPPPIDPALVDKDDHPFGRNNKSAVPAWVWVTSNTPTVDAGIRTFVHEIVEAATGFEGVDDCDKAGLGVTVAGFQVGRYKTSETGPCWPTDATAELRGHCSSSGMGLCTRNFGNEDIYWIDSSGHIQQMSWTDPAGGAGWQGPWDAGGDGHAEARSVDVVSRAWSDLDVFWIDDQGAIRQRSWRPTTGSGNPIALTGPGRALPGAIAAVSRHPSHVEVFWRGAGGLVEHTWWEQGTNGDNWHPPQHIAAQAVASKALTSVSRVPENVDVFWVGVDGSIQHGFWNAHVNAGAWNGPFTIAPPDHPASDGAIASVARVPENVDVFWIDSVGAVMTLNWNAHVNDARWNGPFQIAGPGSAAPGAIASVARKWDNVDVVWIGRDGSVQQMFWNLDGWHGPYAVGEPDGARPGYVGALARVSDEVEFFWFTPKTRSSIGLARRTQLHRARWREADPRTIAHDDFDLPNAAP